MLAAGSALRECGAGGLREVYNATGDLATRPLNEHIRRLGVTAGVDKERLYAYACRHGGAELFAGMGPLLLRQQGGWSETSTVPQRFYQGGSTERALEALATQERIGAPRP